LRWVRNRFRVNREKVDSTEIGKLKLWKCSFGLQRSFDRFIIWQHAIKWKKYAEVFIKERIICIDGFGKPKKRRKVEILFNIINEFDVMTKMKTGRINNIFNRDNLELLIGKIVRERKVSREIYYYKEEEMEIYLEKISKN
jgi:hypothetical protein